MLSGLLIGRPHVTVQLHENPKALEGLAGSIERGAFEFSGIVSLGGSMGAYEDIEWIPVELALMRAAVSAGENRCCDWEFLEELHALCYCCTDIPVLGLCLGGQMLAAALGGTVFLSSKPVCD